MFLRLEDEVGERYTTWSNLVRRPGQAEEAEQRAEVSEQDTRERGRTRTREENNINNNIDSSRKSR